MTSSDGGPARGGRDGEQKKLLERIAALEQSHDRLAQLLADTRIALLVFDRGLRLQRFTPAAGALLGIGMGEIGRPVLHTLASFPDVELLDDAAAFFRAIPIAEREVAIRAGHFLRRLQPYRPAPERVEGLIVTYQDVSDIRAALTRAALACKAGPSVARNDDFLALLAHELRTPLSALYSATQLIRQATLSADRRVSVDRVLIDQVSAIKAIVDDLTTLSRINRGKLLLDRSVIRARKLIEMAWRAQGAEPFSRSISIVVEPEDLSLWIDVERLANGLSQLMSGSARTLSEGQLAQVIVRCEGKLTCIEIGAVNASDSHGSPAPAAMEWKPLMPANTPGDGLGPGIGLELIRELVELHAGSVRVAQTRHGSPPCFEVRLPMMQPESQPSSVQSILSTEAARGLRVLVVDDSVDAADTLAYLLESYDIDVDVAYGGEAAVQAVGRRTPDVVLMDIAMPDMSGIEAAARMRRLENGKGLLIFGLTGFSDSQRESRLMRKFADQVFVKPLMMEKLFDAIGELRKQNTG